MTSEQQRHMSIVLEQVQKSVNYINKTITVLEEIAPGELEDLGFGDAEEDVTFVWEKLTEADGPSHVLKQTLEGMQNIFTLSG